MILSSIIHSVTSILLLSPLGHILFKNSHFLVKIFMGILITSLILALTSRFVPNLSREVVMLISLVSILFILFKNLSYKGRDKLVWKAKINLRMAIHSLIFLAFAGLYLIELSPFLYKFESHDVHVFGPTIEAFNASYSGNLKNPVSFPEFLSSYHTLPGLFVGAASFTNPQITLLSLITTKYLLMTLFFGLVYYYGFTKVDNKLLYIFSLLMVLFLFKETFYYTLSISSFLYALTLLIIGKTALAIKSESNFDEKVLFVVLLSILMVMKIPIFYAVLPALIFLFFKDYKLFVNKKYIFFAVLIFFNLLIIYITPISEQIKYLTVFSIINPFNIDELRTLAGVWFVEMRMLEFFSDITAFSIEGTFFGVTFIEFKQFLIKLFILLFFYYFLLFISIKNIKSLNPTIKASLYIYLITSLLGWIFLRNNGNLDSQSHLFFLISFLSSFFLIYYLSKSQTRFSLNSLIFIFIISVNINDFLNYDFKISGSALDYRVNKSLSYSDIIERNDNSTDRFNLIVDKPFWYNELVSQIEGKRIYKEDIVSNNFDTSASHLIEYVIENKD